MSDKIKHIASCFVIGYVSSMIIRLIGADKNVATAAGVIIAMIFGFGKEILDHYTKGHADDLDIYADLTGSVLGAETFYITFP